MYRPRNPEASPFFRLVRDHFDAFERQYGERFQPKYGYWRPVIRSAIDKFLKCGDLRGGFARVRCPDCGGEMKIISFIEKCQPDVVEKILRHCGLWKDAASRPPPVVSRVADGEPDYDYGYFERICI